MKQWRSLGILALLVALSSPAGGAEGKGALPVVEGEPTLATVNGEPITAEEFFRNLAAIHESAMGGGGQRSKQDPSELLDRLINIRLVLQEAVNIGLDELPKIQAALTAFRKETLRGTLISMQSKKVPAADPEQVEARYRDAVREVKIRTVMVKTEELAQEAIQRVKAGEEFEAVAGDLVAQGTAKPGDETQYVAGPQLLPSVREALAKMAVGDLSPVLDVGDEFAVIELLDVSYPENAAAREEAERQVQQVARLEALEAYFETLRDKYVELDQEMFDGLDLEAAEPGFDALLKDERVLAKIEGDAPIRVMELVQAINKEFFHGIDRAIEQKKVNLRKIPIMNGLLRDKVLLLEAMHLELDESEEFVGPMREFEAGILFQNFMERVIEPGIRIREAELQAYLAEHADDFSTPEMMRLEGLAFDSEEGAEQAMARLREGADFQWVRTHAEGQTDPEREGLIVFPNNLIVTTALADDLRELVSGSAAGDLHAYSPPGGPYYILRIRRAIPPVSEPFETVKDSIVRSVYDEKRKEVLEDWMGKLREASEVEVFATPEALEELVQGMIGGGP